MEDGPDVVGTRLLAALSGIDSLRIRRKALSKKELAKVNGVARANKLDHMFFSYQIGKGIDEVCKAIRDLTSRGCKLIWLDYLQEIRGHGKGDRRNEVAEALTRCHGAASDGGAALMAVSQFRRVGEDLKTGKPRPVGIHHLKESGDLENKARIIVIAQKQPAPDGIRVRFKLAKSTYGGEHVRWDMLRDASGTLRNVHYYKPTEDWG
jgi:replicative DNA helicase